MKTKSIILSGLCLLVLSVTLSSYITKTTLDIKKEEYAIVSVVDFGKKLSIRVTKSGDPASASEYKEEETISRNDFSPVIKVLSQLNEQGFSLLNASLAYETLGGGNSGGSRHTFMMVKK
jgi:hypothetical protein